MSGLITDVAPAPDDGETSPPERGRRRGRLIVLVAAGVVVVLALAGALWFMVGRDRARARSTDEAVETFRTAGTPGTLADPAARRPDAGVYPATASGSESVGIAGLDESFGAVAPVTVTHAENGCFTYRADLNTHHWRSWTYCPTATASFALSGTQSSTLRKFPGLDFGSVNSYTCERPLPAVWPGAVVGDHRDGSCTGTSDTIAGVTTDAGTVDVVELGTRRVGDTEVAAVHIRTADTFGEAQSGTETADLWLAADTGLPLLISFDTKVKSDTPLGTADYVDQGRIELTTLAPTT